MRRTVSGYFFTMTGFLACPCHLVITLPLAVTLLSGTALGGWIATHQGAVTLGAGLYFVGALALGAFLLMTRTSTAHPDGKLHGSDPAPRQDGEGSCCPPAPDLVSWTHCNRTAMRILKERD